jgi:hypothetical protein
MAAVLATSAANAYDDGIKKKCLENPDKVVWIESRGACIPINPCDEKYGDKYGVYCSPRFKYVSVDSVETAVFMIRMFGASSGGSEKVFYIPNTDIVIGRRPWLGDYMAYIFQNVAPNGGITLETATKDVSFCRKYNCGYEISFQDRFQCKCGDGGDYDGMKKIADCYDNDRECEIMR